MTRLHLNLLVNLLALDNCSFGYERRQRKCIDVDECIQPSEVCGKNAQCINTNGSYYCQCDSGFESTSHTANFTLTEGSCIDINECFKVRDVCGPSATCTNAIGSYFCSCVKGYASQSNHSFSCQGRHTGFNKSSERVGAIKTWLTTPQFVAMCITTGSHICIDKRSELYVYLCLSDINECDEDSSICGQLGTCENQEGSYRCRCQDGASNFGNEQAHCVALNCDLYKTDSKSQKLLPRLDTFLSLMRNSCKQLGQSSGGQVSLMSGETLLEVTIGSVDESHRALRGTEPLTALHAQPPSSFLHETHMVMVCCSSSLPCCSVKKVLTAGDDLLSSEALESSSQVSELLSSMENAIKLIGPQLKKNRTRKESKHAEVELLITREKSPPRGPIHLSTEHAQLDTTWETAAGTSAYPGFAVASLVAYKELESTTNGSFHGLSRTHSETSFQINSKVVTAYVSNPDTSHLLTPATFTFLHLQSKDAEHTCVYWDSSSQGGSWSPRGCVKTQSNSTHTVCSCSHLSSFAVLMALYEIKDAFQLQVITWVGLSLSLVCLFLCIVTFSCCRSIQGTRNTIHLHLCISLFIADLTFLSGISSTENRGGCAFIAGLLHFFFLSAFCWMFLEGVQLYRMVVLVFNTTLRTVYMLAAGYGVPLLTVIISAMAYSEGYGTKRYCWLSLERGFIWSFFGPVCVIIVANIFFFIITVWKLAEKFSSLNPDLSKLRKIRTFTITAIAQLCVLGIMWIFGCFQFEESMLAMSYLFTIFNSLQGVLIFVMHCLLSKQVREEYVRFLSCSPVKEKRRDKYSESSSSQALRMTQSTGESQM
ncbi:CD97 antigen precursor-like [Scleropages formosus]|uniref:CD97 antigen-like n=1 Tax=Scleropages formosus TaxID=113540 RepID=A0A0P7WXX2_SCLFO|nr:CD97 antigen precursor-like [Scleropages formosus]